MLPLCAAVICPHLLGVEKLQKGVRVKKSQVAQIKSVGLAAHCLLRDKKSALLIKGSRSQEQSKQTSIVHAGGELGCGMPDHRELWVQEICMSWGGEWTSMWKREPLGIIRETCHTRLRKSPRLQVFLVQENEIRQMSSLLPCAARWKASMGGGHCWKQTGFDTPRI